MSTKTLAAQQAQLDHPVPPVLPNGHAGCRAFRMPARIGRAEAGRALGGTSAASESRGAPRKAALVTALSAYRPSETAHPGTIFGAQPIYRKASSDGRASVPHQNAGQTQPDNITVEFPYREIALRARSGPSAATRAGTSQLPSGNKAQSLAAPTEAVEKRGGFPTKAAEQPQRLPGKGQPPAAAFQFPNEAAAQPQLPARVP